MKVCLCYIIICMKVCLCYIIYLYVCRNEDVYTLYIYMQTCMLLATGCTGVMHYVIHFVLRLSLHLVYLLFGTSSLHLLKFFWKFFIDLFV